MRVELRVPFFSLISFQRHNPVDTRLVGTVGSGIAPTQHLRLFLCAQYAFLFGKQVSIRVVLLKKGEKGFGPWNCCKDGVDGMERANLQ